MFARSPSSGERGRITFLQTHAKAPVTTSAVVLGLSLFCIWQQDRYIVIMIEIHLLNPVHTQAVLALSRRLETEDELPCSYWGLEAENVRDLLNAPNKRTLIALDQEHVAGIGTLKQGEDYQQHLAEISVAVCPKYRRQHLAKRIISELENLAQASGIEIIKVLVWTRNNASQKLFESLQYKYKATLMAEFKSPGFGEIDDHVYYKRL